MTIPVILDCDPGIDDAVAIALMLGTPNVEVVGITTVAGNVPLHITTANALRLTEFFARADVPIIAGAMHPLTRTNVFAEYVHGVDGLGGAPVPEATRELTDGFGPDFIIDRLRECPGEITLIAVGPMTNVALALRKEPRIAQWAKQIVLMGGSFTRGNITPAAEFNFFADPEAAAAVFQADWRPVMIGLDLTLQARVTAEVMDSWRAFGALSEVLLVPALANYFDDRSLDDHDTTCLENVVHVGQAPAIHDACAVAYVIAPELFTASDAMTCIETKGEHTAGMSVVDFAASTNSVVVTDIDLGGFWNLMHRSLGVVASAMRRR